MAVPFIEVTLPSDTTEARRFQDTIEQQMIARKVGDRDIFNVRLALEEALVNAIKHGNQFDPNKRVFVKYRFLGDIPGIFEIEIMDQGPGFDPSDVPDPTAVENLERPCGRGLMLMRHYMTEVEYRGSGNEVVMSKVFHKPS